MEYKVLDKGFVRIVDKMGTDSSIVQAARVSYGKGTKHVSQDRSLIRYLFRHKHTTPFEMCVIKLHIKVPIFIARQWIRHRTASVNEYSGRYSLMKEEFYIPNNLYSQSENNKQCSSDNKLINSEELIEKIKKHSDDSYALYEELLKQGVSRETARIILPMNIYTEFYWQMNLHNLLHFVKLRSDLTSQSEIREYSKIIEKIIKEWVPLTYEAYEDYSLNSLTFSSETKKSILIKENYDDSNLSATEKKEFENLINNLK